MSNARPSRRARLPRGRLAEAALAATRAAGCTCAPDMVLHRGAGGVLHVHVAHDDWCPLLVRQAARWN